MSLMSMAIVGACATAQSGACVKSLEAGTKQYGIEQNVDTFEQKTTTKANKEAYNLLGDTGVQALGGGFFLAKTAIDKYVMFQVPTLGVCDSVVSQVGLDFYKLKLEWNF